MVTASVSKASLGCCVDHLVRAQLRGTASAVNYLGSASPLILRLASVCFREYSALHQQLRLHQFGANVPLVQFQPSRSVSTLLACTPEILGSFRLSWNVFAIPWCGKPVTNRNRAVAKDVWAIPQSKTGAFSLDYEHLPHEFEFGPLKISVVRAEEQICGLSQRGR